MTYPVCRLSYSKSAKMRSCLSMLAAALDVVGEFLRRNLNR
jgi:hypothetical protein